MPSDKKMLCATKPREFCQYRQFSTSIILSSTLRCPSCGSISPNKISIRVDLPEPDEPTMPITLLAGIIMLSCFRVGSALFG